MLAVTVMAVVLLAPAGAAARPRPVVSLSLGNASEGAPIFFSWSSAVTLRNQTGMGVVERNSTTPPVEEITDPTVLSGLVMPKTLRANMYHPGRKPSTHSGKLVIQTIRVKVQYQDTPDAFDDKYVRVGKGVLQKQINGHWRLLGDKWSYRGNEGAPIWIVSTATLEAPLQFWHPGDHYRVLETNMVKDAATQEVVATRTKSVPIAIHHGPRRG